MRIFIITIVLLLSAQLSNAQLFSKEKILNRENFDKQRYTWGYYLGFNSYDYKFDYNELTEEINTETSVGFNVGLVGDVRLNDYFNLRLEPGIVFVNRTLTFPDTSLMTPAQQEREVVSTYINVPLLLKFSTKRKNNWKPFVVGGFSWSSNLSSNEENPDDNSAGQFRQMTNVFNYEIGIGVDLYLFYFKFSPSIRGVFAMTDELVPDMDVNSPWTGNISSMQSRGIFINFTFQ
ncbi:type IX secretion/gliding motility protein PorT/SprT [Nonlabens tegetincola]|uniref:type IX secretion/gliding motility protein PorT/SprT n=1 Tax=Nonlabens tegetincola TaxID=323273 RepID=UPI000CF47AD8|nr:porin family protein [Nonlabens tegetincola]PQJ19124.1 PorT protein [Nonlabens tegetincola]